MITLGQPYLAFTGMDLKENKLSYCYEPAFGYKLEKIPAHVRESNFKNIIDAI